MIRRFPIYVVMLLSSMLVLLSCNKKDEDAAEAQEVSYTSVAVTSFSLSKNSKVLANLDSVFFSIDLNNCVIFNADSLPKGTNVSKLVLKIGLPTVSSATLVMAPDKEGKVRTVDYLTASSDSIDFSNGDVTLKLVSLDEQTKRDYVIKVNVHKVDADMLSWGDQAMRALPGEVASPKAQKAVKMGDKVYCFVSDGSSTVLSIAANPGGEWETKTAAMPSGSRLETLRTAGDKLFVLDADGLLFVSADGLAWTATAQTFHWLYGDYNGSLLASREGATGWEVVSYPEMTAMTAPADFPVEGTSALLSTSNNWSTLPTAVMIGGRKADGTLTGDTWGYDGNTWMEFNTKPLPESLEGITLIPYLSYVTNISSWSGKEYPSLIALGGRNAAGEAVKSVYISLDNGIAWKTADELMQLPDYMPALSGADALVFTSMLGSRSMAAGWREMPSRSLPAWLMVDRFMPRSRVVTPVEEWECPYIYLFGGYGASGLLEDWIWRGVINRLTFKPLE